jgi:DNA-directed RNA polymerase specialized sigma24 family protein
MHARGVERSAALRLLSRQHAEIIRLSDEEFDIADIARRLSLEPSAVAPMLEIARAKLAALEARAEVEPAPDLSETREADDA